MPITPPLGPHIAPNRKSRLAPLRRARLSRKADLLAVFLTLLLEQFPRGHAHDARADALFLAARSVNAQPTLRCRCRSRYHLRLGVVGVRANTSRLSPHRRQRPYLVRSSVGNAWRVSSQRHRSRLQRHDDAPRFDNFVGVGRPQKTTSRESPQRGANVPPVDASVHLRRRR